MFSLVCNCSSDCNHSKRGDHQAREAIFSAADCPTIDQQVATLLDRRERMERANDLIGQWGALRARPALAQLGFRNELIAQIAPYQDAQGFTPADFLAVEMIIRRLKAFRAQVSDGTTIPISRSYADDAGDNDQASTRRRHASRS